MPLLLLMLCHIPPAYAFSSSSPVLDKLFLLSITSRHQLLCLIISFPISPFPFIRFRLPSLCLCLSLSLSLSQRPLTKALQFNNDLSSLALLETSFPCPPTFFSSSASTFSEVKILIMYKFIKYQIVQNPFILVSTHLHSLLLSLSTPCQRRQSGLKSGGSWTRVKKFRFFRSNFRKI